MINKQDVADSLETNSSVVPAEIYANAVNAGTEEITQEDLNTPILSINQPTTQELAGRTLGYFHRSDTNRDYKEIDSNLVYVTTIEQEKYNKDGIEKVKVYYGFYAGTNEPFKLYVRGYSLQAHRAFQSEIARIKRIYAVPMFALTVRLTTEEKKGTIKESNKPFSVFMMKEFKVLEEAESKKPLIEMDPNRISFLFEALNRFKAVNTISNENDRIQNSEPLPWEDK